MVMAFIVPDDAFQYGVPCREYGILRQVADVQVPFPHYGAPIRLFQPGRDFKEGGLAGSVDADDADLLALIDSKIRVVEQQALRV